MGSIKGIECSLYDDKIGEVLHFLSNESFAFFIQRCAKIDDSNIALPKMSYDFWALPYDLRKLAKDSIWELVIHIYHTGSKSQTIRTYDDFVNSQCIGCLVFYDCGLLDVYTKETNLYEKLYNLLLTIEAQDIEVMPDVPYDRIHLSL